MKGTHSLVALTIGRAGEREKKQEASKGKKK
jgi:hypothetical protein